MGTRYPQPRAHGLVWSASAAKYCTTIFGHSERLFPVTRPRLQSPTPSRAMSPPHPLFAHRSADAARSGGRRPSQGSTKSNECPDDPPASGDKTPPLDPNASLLVRISVLKDSPSPAASDVENPCDDKKVFVSSPKLLLARAQAVDPKNADHPEPGHAGPGAADASPAAKGPETSAPGRAPERPPRTRSTPVEKFRRIARQTKAVPPPDPAVMSPASAWRSLFMTMRARAKPAAEDAEEGPFLQMLPPKLEADVRGLCAAHLPRFMVPRIFVQCQDMPKTLSGKINRRGLRAPSQRLLIDMASRSRAQPGDEPDKREVSLPVPAEVTAATERVIGELTAMTREILKWDEGVSIDVHTPLTHLGIGSMQLTRLVSLIRSKLLASASLGRLLALPVITIASLGAIIAQQIEEASAQAADKETETEQQGPSEEVEPPAYFWFTTAQIAFLLVYKLALAALLAMPFYVTQALIQGQFVALEHQALLFCALLLCVPLMVLPVAVLRRAVVARSLRQYLRQQRMCDIPARSRLHFELWVWAQGRTGLGMGVELCTSRSMGLGHGD